MVVANFHFMETYCHLLLSLCSNLTMMKTLFFLSCMLMAGSFLISCQEKEQMTSENDATEANVAAYDSVLATQLNADDYGMKKYVMAFLKPGPNRNQDSLEAAQ